jgi:hypothetical protein
MQIIFSGRSRIAGVGIAINAAIQACVIHPYIHAPATAAIGTLVSIRWNIQAAPQDFFNASLINTGTFINAIF